MQSSGHAHYNKNVRANEEVRFYIYISCMNEHSSCAIISVCRRSRPRGSGTVREGGADVQQRQLEMLILTRSKRVLGTRVLKSRV